MDVRDGHHGLLAGGEGQRSVISPLPSSKTAKLALGHCSKPSKTDLDAFGQMQIPSKADLDGLGHLHIASKTVLDGFGRCPRGRRHGTASGGCLS